MDTYLPQLQLIYQALLGISIKGHMSGKELIDNAGAIGFCMGALENILVELQKPVENADEGNAAEGNAADTDPANENEAE